MLSVVVFLLLAAITANKYEYILRFLLTYLLTYCGRREDGILLLFIYLLHQTVANTNIKTKNINHYSTNNKTRQTRSRYELSL